MKGKFTGLLLSTLLLAQGSYADVQDSGEACCDGWGTFDVGAEWLYWRADQNDMNYAIHNTSVVESDTLIDTFRDPIRTKFTGDNGYRIFAGYQTCDCNWKVGAIFTHAPSRASSSAVSPTPLTTADYIQTLPVNFALLNSTVLSNFSETEAKWDLDLNYFDLDFQRNISICQCFEIAPHVGFRALWMDQTFRFRGITLLGTTSFGKAKLKVEGYGIEGGLLGTWNVGCGFSILGNIGGSLLYSRVNSHGVLSYSVSTLSVNDHYRDTVRRSIPTFDTFIGVQYAMTYCDYDIGVRVGWENHIFFDVNQFSLNKIEDLTMQGLTLGAFFGF